MLFLFSLLLANICLTWGDFGIYGVITDSVELLDDISKAKSYSTCYAGFGYTNCDAKQADDDSVLRNTLPYYRSFDETHGTNYCLQCCSENPGPDVWELECLQYTEVGPKIQVYGYELRMARKLTLTDTEVVRCPIYRTACTYNESDPLQVIECDADDTYLWGITVEFWVTIRSKNFFSWRSVEKCVVTSDERSEPLPNMALFAENYIIYHSRVPQTFSAFDGTMYSLLSLLAIYWLIYFFRRDKCIICEKKLVLFCEICYLCRFYGAHPPDPLLLQAMKEKGDYLQGEFPERFPGVRRCIRCVNCIIAISKGIYNCLGYTLQGIQYFFMCIFCCKCKQCWDSIYCCHGCKCLCCSKCCRRDLPVEPTDQKLRAENKTVDPQSDDLEENPLIHTGSHATLESAKKSEINSSRRGPAVHSKASVATSLVSSNPTAPGGIKAPKRPKKNPYRINVHPYFVYKALDHPYPPSPPLWVQHRNLEEYEE